MVLVVQKTVSELLFLCLCFLIYVQFSPERERLVNELKKEPVSCREREQRNGNLTLSNSLAF